MPSAGGRGCRVARPAAPVGERANDPTAPSFVCRRSHGQSATRSQLCACSFSAPVIQLAANVITSPARRRPIVFPILSSTFLHSQLAALLVADDNNTRPAARAPQSAFCCRRGRPIAQQLMGASTGGARSGCRAAPINFARRFLNSICPPVGARANGQIVMIQSARFRGDSNLKICQFVSNAKWTRARARQQSSRSPSRQGEREWPEASPLRSVSAAAAA